MGGNSRGRREPTRQEYVSFADLDPITLSREGNARHTITYTRPITAPKDVFSLSSFCLILNPVDSKSGAVPLDHFATEVYLQKGDIVGENM